ncbi:hypothetical protein QP166_03930 [Sphingomonas sp. LR60]|uniref:hypothetical protein n=1 Tax=Sphingomonas sp. LR60 TaxID=3050233 RepID=UPI002FE0DA46
MSVVLALALQAAAQPTGPRHKVSQADLNAMADACHAPRTSLVLTEHSVLFRSSPDADLAKIDCLVRKVSAVVPMEKIGFIGNGRASKEK